MLPPDFAQGMFYNDLEEEQAKHWTSLLKPQSEGYVMFFPKHPNIKSEVLFRVYDSPLTHETYKEISSGYLLASNDQAFKYDYQVKTVEMVGFPKEMTKTMETGHMPLSDQSGGSEGAYCPRCRREGIMLRTGSEDLLADSNLLSHLIDRHVQSLTAR